MTDTLGSRKVFGVVTPSTNTVVQPEYDAMRPAGVVNHMEGMFIPDDPVGSDADFNELIRRIDVALEDALEPGAQPAEALGRAEELVLSDADVEFLAAIGITDPSWCCTTPQSGTA